jgi:hypothetical protein
MHDQALNNPATTPTEAMSILPFPTPTPQQMSLLREMLAEVGDEAAAQALLDELIALDDAGSDDPVNE